MPKAIFKGMLSFGLVNVPISIYPVAEPKLLAFHWLHKSCGRPVKLKKYCEYCKKELKKEDIVYGIRIGKNKYVEFNEEQIKALKPKGKADMEIIMFTDAVEIDDIYFDKAYYLLPQKPEDKAYWLFYEILKLSGKVAIVKFIFHEKQYIGFIKAYKTGLLLRILHYAYEIRKIEKLQEAMPRIKFSKQQLSLARELIDRLYQEKFDISQFKDEFSEKIKQVLMKKLKVEVRVEKERERDKKKEKKKETLIELLKKSVKS